MQDLQPTSPLDTGIPLEWLNSKAYELARQIAAKIDRPGALAARFGLSTDQWEALRTSAFFREKVVQAMRDLGGTTGLKETIQIQALYALSEFGVLELAKVASNEKLNTTQRIDAIRELKDIAQIGGKVKAADGAAAPGTGPLITIVVGNQRTDVALTPPPPIDVTPEPAP